MYTAAWNRRTAGCSRRSPADLPLFIVYPRLHVLRRCPIKGCLEFRPQAQAKVLGLGGAPLALRGARSFGLSWLVSVCTIGPAGAEPTGLNGLPVIVDYEAPPECPAASDFRQELTQRLSRPRAASPEAAASSSTPTTVRVRIRRAGQRGFEAELVTQTRVGASTPRNLSGSDCAALSEALAFTAALALDPEGQLPSAGAGQADSSQAANEGLPPSTVTTSDEASPTPQTDDASPNQQPTPATGAETDALEDPSTSSLPPPDFTWGDSSSTSAPGFWTSALGAGVQLASPLTTGIDTGFYAQLSLFRETRESSTAWPWTPAVLLSVHVLRNPWAGSGETASFFHTSAQASLCPSRVTSGAFAWSICATGQYGALFAYGEQISASRRVQTSTTRLGATLWFEYELFGALNLSAQLSGLADILPYSFHVDEPMNGRRPIAETRGLSPWLGLGVSTPL